LYEEVASSYVKKMEEVLSQPETNFSTASSGDVSKKPGVYVIRDKKLGEIIYVGRTGSLRRRLLRDHRRGNVEGSLREALGMYHALKTEAEITDYILRNCSFQFMPVGDPEELVRLEHFATAILAPALNVKLKR
jgi:excinuclease UvrABC nuclease subunit